MKDDVAVVLFKEQVKVAENFAQSILDSSSNLGLSRFAVCLGVAALKDTLGRTCPDEMSLALDTLRAAVKSE